MQYAGDEAQQAKQRTAVQKCLEPLRQTLKDTKWLGGKSINYADLCVAGTFMVSAVCRTWWANWRCTMLSSSTCGQVMIDTLNLCLQLASAVGVELLEKDDPVYEWRERLFKGFEETISKNGKYKETSA